MTNHVVYVDEDLKDLIPGFIENRYEELNQIETALKQHDFKSIEKIGHNIKGVGGGYGFDYISEIGKQIEETARAEDGEELQEIVQAYRTYLDNVEIVYQ